MISDILNKDNISSEIKKGNVVLFLGAGVNFGSEDSNGESIGDSKKLIEDICSEFDIKINNSESLQKLFQYLETINKYESVLDFVKNKYSNCSASLSIINIFSNYWKRIYTTNIDNVIEDALIKNSREFESFNHVSKVKSHEVVSNTTQVVHLHGMAENIKEGIIFSKDNYTHAISLTPAWYDQLANDIYDNHFIYIGTKLDEPVFDYVLHRHHQKLSNESPHGGYLIIPEPLSFMDVAIFEGKGIHPIRAGVDDFSDWLKLEIPNRLTALDVAKHKFPEFDAVYGCKPKKILEIVAKLCDVTIVNGISASAPISGRVCDFYNGFKPTWKEISGGVSANLEHESTFYKSLLRFCNTAERRLLCLIGPAGSGKSTCLMKAALKLSQENSSRIFFVPGTVEDFGDVVLTISQISTGVIYIFSDALDTFADQIAQILDKGLYSNVRFVCSDRRNLWMERNSSKLGSYCTSPQIVAHITKNDARSIRDKIEKYGPFGILRKRSEEDQISIIYDKSDRQLLIGLMEATRGVGFEKIIQNEFDQLDTPEHVFLLLMCSIASNHRLFLPANLLFRAFGRTFGRPPSAKEFNELAGIINFSGNKYEARHPVYAQHLLERCANKDDIGLVLDALMLALSEYPTPIFYNAPKNVFRLFQYIFRYKFIASIFESEEKRCLKFYKDNEKYFDGDGNFLMHYGLMYRKFEKHELALNKLNYAAEVYNGFTIRHAKAHQQLIVAGITSDSGMARNLITDAIEILENLNNERFSYTALYPLVTLAEGHTKAVLSQEGIGKARKLARLYIQRVQSEMACSENDVRLTSCGKKLVNFVNGNTNDIELVD